MLKDAHIIVGITGGIAAYKSVFLVRQLVAAGAQVRCFLTAGGRQFIGPATLSALSSNPVPNSLWELAEQGEVGHVETARWADAIVVAPASANFVSRLAAGRGDDALSLVILDSEAPVLIAPAMESHMYENSLFQVNLQRLMAQDRYHRVGPAAGELASGRTGLGRMSEVEDIFFALQCMLTPNNLAGRKIVVSAGATREYMDPVRFISNPSTGKMGVALAKAAARHGADVTLVSANIDLPVPAAVRHKRVNSTQEMLDAITALMPDNHMLIMAAAPADFTPVVKSTHKLKKTALTKVLLNLEFEPAPDILTEVGQRFSDVLLVGFAAETHNLIEYAKGKLKQKRLAMIVANDVSKKDAGFAADTNQALVMTADGQARQLGLQSKEEMAEKLMEFCRELFD